MNEIRTLPREEIYESKTVYVEKLATFLLRDGRWDVCFYNEIFKSNEKYFRVRIPIPPELITGTVDAVVTKNGAMT